MGTGLKLEYHKSLATTKMNTVVAKTIQELQSQVTAGLEPPRQSGESGAAPCHSSGE